MKLPILLLLGLVSCAAGGKNWAMLFTGAWGYYNYSTHANLCHAYQLLHKAGIPAERIVLIMYNDVANDPKNPFPGKLFNNYKHVDVFQGTTVDYSGKEVTADLVLAVLKGDKAAVKQLTGRDGKVLDAGPEDDVFVAVSDHGDNEIILMPDRDMTAKELNQALQYMHDNKKYSKLVFYLESCHSGSMFDQLLPKDINVYAITASGPNHDAWMNYCDDPAFTGPSEVCIGGQFSTAWLENTELVNINNYTFQEQSEAIKKGVNRSHPQLYGDMSLLKLPLSDFFAGQSGARQFQSPGHPQTNPGFGGVQVPFNTMRLNLLKRQVKRSPADLGPRLELARLEALMADADRFFRLTAEHVYPGGSKERLDRITKSGGERVRNSDCYEAALRAVSSSCQGLRQEPSVQGYFISRYSVLINLCNQESGPVVARAVRAAATRVESCQQH